MNHRPVLIALLPLLLSLAACDPSDTTTPSDTEILETPDWTEETHGKSADPNYDLVFAENQVQTLAIVIDPTDWQAMLDDMTANYGEFGEGGMPPPPPLAESASAIPTGDNPIWAPASVFHDGIEWYKVGLRFKGNSSLNFAWSSGYLKLPLKLDFDEYEDLYPQIENQRFHGFKQLSLSSGFMDPSLMREKVAAEIFRAAGLVAPATAFYRVTIDHGDGPIYFGLYTVVEVVDDTVIESAYADDDGNLYKPEGASASFSETSLVLSQFEKKSNESAADWSDVLALHTALHDGNRLTDAAAWRAGLEATLNTDRFLHWLAVNTVIQNWDTYGKMTHNYYLYNDPATGRLDWIPWDNNEALQEGKMGGALDLDLADTGDDWPLIRFLMDDPVYSEIYRSRVAETVAGPFEAGAMALRYGELADQIRSHAADELVGYTYQVDAGGFETALGDLTAHASERAAAVAEYLAAGR
jgi:spore coat protein H